LREEVITLGGEAESSLRVLHEMLRPAFSRLDRRPLSESCTFMSFESVNAIPSIGHLAHTSDSVIGDYEEKAEA
jgi:hypothetical protein